MQLFHNCENRLRLSNSSKLDCVRLALSLHAFNNKDMKITIINSERNEKRYTREELDEFVAQLKDGTYHQQYVSDYTKEVCFAAEWLKRNGEMKAMSLNNLMLLSLENLRDLATVEAYKRLTVLQPYTLLCFLGHDGHSLHIVCPYIIYYFRWRTIGNGIAQRLPQTALHLFVAVGHPIGRARANV